nr:BNR-4 repeat-containing protein [uncultured Caldimonas sp.]
MNQTVSTSERGPIARDAGLLTEGGAHGLPPEVIDCWRLGNWTQLCETVERIAPTHQAFPFAALLSAAGCLQLGRTDEARRHIEQARHAGVSEELVRRVLVSGVHNSLARAAALLGDGRNAVEHARHSVQLLAPEGERVQLTEARLRNQLEELQLPRARIESWVPFITEQTDELKIERIAAIDLGPAWAGNTVNTVIFRHHGILTWGEYQYTAFYVDERCLRLVRRELSTNRIETHDLVGEYNVRDAHNCISLGVDREDCLHICYDHHATRLRYRRATRPHAIDAWTDELSMSGVNEDKVTYPTFILPRAGYPLTLLYRDGVYNKGSARLKTYDEYKKIWIDRPIPILSGADHKPWTSNPYWNHPAIGTDGSIHLSFVWRTDPLGEQQLVNNVNICYAWSPDNGQSWFTSQAKPYGLPITQVNAEAIRGVSPGSNLINQSSMAVDNRGRPHIVYYSNDIDSIPQYHHSCFDGREWQHQIITRRTSPFTLGGGGTLRIPISRPEVLVDTRGNVFVVLRGDLTLGRMSVIKLGASESELHVGRPKMISPLWPDDLGYAEPVLDRSRWAQDNVLSLLLQFNEQPDGDRGCVPRNEPIRLADFKFV